MTDWEAIWKFLAQKPELHCYGWYEKGWLRIETKKNEYNINDSYSLHRVKQIVKLAEEDNKN